MKKNKFLIGLVCLVTMGTMNVWAESLQVQISKSTEDAEERIGTGKVYLKSSDLELGEEKGKGAQLVGLRFRHVNLPKGAEITNAYVQFTVDEKSTQQTSLTIWGEKTRSSHSFVDSRSSISNRAITWESVDWYPNPWRSIGEHGVNQRTPDLSSIIQEIIDQSGWNKTIGLRITGIGSRVAESYDGSANKAPILYIEYTKDSGNTDEEQSGKNSIGDLVWNDANRDGLQNNNESGIGGLLVELLDKNKVQLATINTDNGGKYLFSGLDDGRYYIRVDLMNGAYKTTTKRVRGDSNDGLDSNAYYKGVTSRIVLAGNSYNDTIDIGLYRDVEEIAPEISVLDASNIMQHSATIYWNTNVKTTAQVEYGKNTAYGLWTVKDSQLIDNHALGLNNLQACSTYHYRVISQDQNGNSVTSNDNTFKTICAETKNSIGDLVWNDANRDGLQNNNESGIGGLLVELLDKNKVQLATINTDNGGKYLFSGLDDGKYYIRVDLMNGTYKTTKKRVRGDSNDGLDSNAHGNGRTFSFELKGNSYNDTIDIGLYRVTTADTIKPIITLLGEAEVSVLQGDKYEDAGATAQDNIDGDITHNIAVDNQVDTATLGTYTVTYNVSDAAGNVADRVSRVVNVVEKDNPINLSICDDGKSDPDQPCTVSTFHNISVYWNSDDIGNVELSYKKHGETSWKKAQELTYNRTIYVGKDYRKPDTDDLLIDSNSTYPEDNTVVYETAEENKEIEKRRRIVVDVKHGSVTSKSNYRGSIVNLSPNTIYDIKVGNSNVIIHAKTWSEEFPINPEENLFNTTPESSNAMYILNRIKGNKNGYILIDGKKFNNGNKYIIDGNTKNNILIKNSSYIILRNFVLKNAQKDAIRIVGKYSHHIVIEHCDISAWGEKATWSRRNDKSEFKDYNTSAVDGQGAITSHAGIYGSVFQYNTIHDPNFQSNTWGEFNFKNYGDADDYTDEDWYHPKGAQGIVLKYCKIGNNVIRYNAFYTNENKFMDIVGGGKNDGAYGFPGADSDIYGNYFNGATDEAIESEGGVENVRIWNNYIENTFMAIGNANVTTGPLYIWKNIIGPAAVIKACYSPKNVTERCDVSGFKPTGSFIKMGKSGTPIDQNGSNSQDKYRGMEGNIYIYNNTIFNPNESNGYGGIGTSYKPNHAQRGKPMRHVYSKNNILDILNTEINAISVKHDKSTDTQKHTNNMIRNPLNFIYKNDEYKDYTENSIEGEPTYGNTQGLSGEGHTRVGDFRLLPNSAGTREGVCIDNIIPRPSPDVGAQQRNESTMTFGIHAKFIPPVINSCN